MENGRLTYDENEYSKFMAGDIFSLVCKYESVDIWGDTTVFIIDFIDGYLDTRIDIYGTRGKLYGKFYFRDSILNLNLVDIVSNRCGAGTMMMNGLMEAVQIMEKRTGLSCQWMYGWLSPYDKGCGHWEKAVSFYQRYAEKNGIRSIFTSRWATIEKIRNNEVETFNAQGFLERDMSEGQVWYIF